MEIQLNQTTTQEIRLDGSLWGYAIWVGNWYVVYRWESEMQGSLRYLNTADTIEDIERVVKEELE